MKRKMKEYADNKAYVKPTSAEVGDVIIVKRSFNYNKSQSPYDPKPYRVIAKKGSMITAARPGHEVTRNSSFIKPVDINGDFNIMKEGEGSEEEENDESLILPTAVQATPTPIDTGSQKEQNVRSPEIDQDIREPEVLRRSQRDRKPPRRLTEYLT